MIVILLVVTLVVGIIASVQRRRWVLTAVLSAILAFGVLTVLPVGARSGGHAVPVSPSPRTIP
jgi:hypothetical protein